MAKITVTMATLQSHDHIAGDIEQGIKIFKNGNITFNENEPNRFCVQVPCRNDFKTINLSFSRDGFDLADYNCNCSRGKKKNQPVCKHVVAAVLEIQNGVIESCIKSDKTGVAVAVVSEKNTAKAMKSGALEVFATPAMIALMEEAACACLLDGLDVEQTSVGTAINVLHTSASPIGAEITATATIEKVFGRKIEFKVSASDGEKEIGSGTHTRMIVDIEKFMKRIALKR